MIFHQRPKFRWRSWRSGYQQSGTWIRGIWQISWYFTKDQNSGEWAQDKGTNKVANSINTSNLANMANLTIFRQRPKFRRMSSGQGYQQSGEFDEYGKFNDISPKTKIQVKELKIRVPTKWYVNSRNMANFMIFHKRPKFRRMSSRQGYQQSSKFDKYVEFGKYGKFNDISPKTKIQANELKTRVPTKWRIQLIWRIWQIWRIFDDISPKTKIQANELKTRVPTEWWIQRIWRIWQICRIWWYFAKDQNASKWAQDTEGYQQSGEFDEYGEFDDISPKTKIQANELKTRVPTKWWSWGIQRIWQIWWIWWYFAKDQNASKWAQDKGTNKVANLTDVANLANMANLTIFRQRPKFRWMSSRQRYQQSGEFVEYGEFGKYGEFDDISAKTKMQANELKTRVPTKWWIRRFFAKDLNSGKWGKEKCTNKAAHWTACPAQKLCLIIRDDGTLFQ